MSTKPDVLESWDEMSDQIAQRLAEGDLEYAHDPAENKPTSKLLTEIEEEILDICAWSLFAWQRIQTVREQFEELETRRDRLYHMTPIPEYLP